MTVAQSNKVKEGINSFLTPILMVIVGWFIIQSINANTIATEKLSDRIYILETRDKTRDAWVLQWTEKWQPVLHWAENKMKSE